MAGYSKNIAVIKGVKDGFSQGAGELSGLVKAEKFGTYFRAEISFINFAPLSQGRYVTGISDGEVSLAAEGAGGEFESAIDTSSGFAAAVCFVKDGVVPGAVAFCGDMAWAVPLAVRAVEEAEKLRGAPAAGAAYEDEAIAEDNYYEYGKSDKGKGDVRQGEEQKDGDICGENEVDSGICGGQTPSGSRLKERPARNEQVNEKPREGDMPPFYKRMRDEIERLFSSFPHERLLEDTVEGSRWVRINYGGKRFYVFGVVTEDGVPSCICYGVPAHGSACPDSLKGMAGFIPAGKDGYWVMYQDAATGASVKTDAG